MSCERLNYGLALSSNGKWQVVDTTLSPGIRDDYSMTKSEPFTFFVAPAQHMTNGVELGVDLALGINKYQDDEYEQKRKDCHKYRPQDIKKAILDYLSISTRPRTEGEDRGEGFGWKEDEKTTWFPLIQSARKY